MQVELSIQSLCNTFYVRSRPTAWATSPVTGGWGRGGGGGGGAAAPPGIWGTSLQKHENLKIYSST